MEKGRDICRPYRVVGELYVRASAIEMFLQKVYPRRKVSVIREIRERRPGWIRRLLRRRVCP